VVCQTEHADRLHQQWRERDMIGVVLFYARTGQVCKFGVALLCRIIVALRMGYSATQSRVHSNMLSDRWTLRIGVVNLQFLLLHVCLGCPALLWSYSHSRAALIRSYFSSCSIYEIKRGLPLHSKVRIQYPSPRPGKPLHWKTSEVPWLQTSISLSTRREFLYSLYIVYFSLLRAVASDFLQ
jgi:hypothetical protein